MTFPRSCRGKRSRPPLPSSRQRFSFPSAPRNGVFAAFSFVTCIVDTMCYHQSAHIEFSAGGSPPGAPTPGVQRHCAPRRTWGVFFTSPLPPTSRQLRHPCWRTSGAPALLSRSAWARRRSAGVFVGWLIVLAFSQVTRLGAAQALTSWYGLCLRPSQRVSTRQAASLRITSERTVSLASHGSGM